MSATVGCIVVRNTSRRLPGKALKHVGDTTLIQYLIRKLKRSTQLDMICLCTSTEVENDVLVRIASEERILSYRGDPVSVISRMLAVAERESASTLVRITGDNVFTDEVYMDLMLKKHHSTGADYTRVEELPQGVTAEAINVGALQRCNRMIPEEFSQYLMLYMFQPKDFVCQVLIPPIEHRRSQWSLTVDTPNDLERTNRIVDGSPVLLYYSDILEICEHKDIPYLFASQGGEIRLPAGVCMGYDVLRMEMKRRMEKSKCVPIELSEYNHMQNEGASGGE